MDRCRQILKDTQITLEHTRENYQRLADLHRNPAPPYQPGQSVWLSTENIPFCTETHKLSPRFISPFPVIEVINPSAVKLKLPNPMKIHPAFHVSQLKPVSSSDLSTLTSFGLLPLGLCLVPLPRTNLCFLFFLLP